jgi:hypothetical protein
VEKTDIGGQADRASRIEHRASVSITESADSIEIIAISKAFR